MGLFDRKKDLVTNKFDESVVPSEIQELEKKMASRVAGQSRAIQQFVGVHETVLAGLAPLDRPLGVFLFVGPTGSGKTHVAEVFSEIQDVPIIKIDCAEFQHSHEIAKLIGSPPGYVGGEIVPKINKEAIEKTRDGKPAKYGVILFDEIEKGHNALHQILLGIMDRGTITTGKNVTIDLKNCIIIMTSNLGSGEVKKLLQTSGGYGFIKKAESVSAIVDLDQDIYRASKDAVTKFFSPEFFNRIDRMVVFRALTQEMLRAILDMELSRLQDRVLKAGKFISVEATERGKAFLIEEGTSKEFGARELRRTIERYLVAKLKRALATGQAVPGDMVLADKEPGKDDMSLDIVKDAMIIPKPKEETPIVKQPKKVFITPESPDVSGPRRGILAPDYCARCGYRWYDAHMCFDLVDSPLEDLRRDAERRRKPEDLDPFGPRWPFNKPGSGW